MKPLLLLDVDGVLLPFGGKMSKDAEPIHLPWGQTVVGCTGMRSRLARLRDDFEFHWATMWQEDANTALASWHSLPQLPYVQFTQNGIDFPDEELSTQTFVDLMAGRTYKLGSVASYVKDRPVAWIDDELFGDAYDWAEERNATDVPTLLLRTNASLGLTDADVDYLLEFAKAVRAHNGMPDPE